MRRLVLLLALLAPALARADVTVRAADIVDQKAVFATVESPNVVPARARIGGTVARLAVRQGDAVTQGQVLATVADDKLLLQITALDAQIAGLQSQLAQAHIDLNRAETLWRQGAGPRAMLDQARTALDVAQSSLNARIAERDVARQQLQEGDVLAPVAGRVLTVPLTRGSVVMNGDSLATIGEQPFKLRLRIPERHAVTLKVGDSIRIDAQQLGAEHGARGTVTLIYPRIEEGRVVADAQVDRLGDYFVGDRIRVWITAGSRPGFVIPPDYVTTRFGLDYVSLRTATGIIAAPVQRGGRTPDGLEILSGLRAGDVLAQP
jgi:RND family efflux transporter MFP subunit